MRSISAMAERNFASLFWPHWLLSLLGNIYKCPIPDPNEIYTINYVRTQVHRTVFRLSEKFFIYILSVLPFVKIKNQKIIFSKQTFSE